MSTEKNLSNLVINKVASQEVYDYMKQNNLINTDELYFVQGEGDTQKKLYDLVLEDPIVEDVPIAKGASYAFPTQLTLSLWDKYYLKLNITNGSETHSREFIGVVQDDHAHGIALTFYNNKIYITNTEIVNLYADSITATLCKIVSYSLPTDITILDAENGAFVQAENAHAEGLETVASGFQSHAEGYRTIAYQPNSHAEGSGTFACGYQSHAEGDSTTALGESSHAEGLGTISGSGYQHVEGKYNVKDSDSTYIHIAGNGSSDTARSNAHAIDWSGNAWFSGDVYVGSDSGTNKDSGSKKLATEEYVGTAINTLDSVAFDGYVTKGKKYGTTVGSRATAEGYGTTASGNYSHAEGSDTISSGQDSHAEGYRTTASGSSSHAEGFSDNIVPETITSDSSKDDIVTAWNTSKFALARGSYAHIEGWSNLALGSASHAEGKMTIANGNWSHTEGIGTETGEDGTHAEGWDTKATDYAAHSEGRSTVASGKNSHSEGYGTTASGESSHAEGVSTVASGRGSHAEGEGTIANTALQHVEGKYNVKDFVTYVHIVGNGTSDTNRSNAHTLDWSGNAWYAGKVSVGTTDNIKDPTADNELVTKKYVDSKTGGIEDFSLDADAWNGTESPYSQVVTLSGVTANSKVDIQPTAEQLNSLATNRTILNTANDNGTVTVYAIGNKPTESYTMQATITGV